MQAIKEGMHDLWATNVENIIIPTAPIAEVPYANFIFTDPVKTCHIGETRKEHRIRPLSYDERVYKPLCDFSGPDHGIAVGEPLELQQKFVPHPYFKQGLQPNILKG